MKYGTFDRGNFADPVHHIEAEYRRALCSGSRLSTITHDTSTEPSAFGGRLCRSCLQAWEKPGR